MAELIDKGALLETVKQEKQTLQGNIYRAAVCMVEDKIKRMPTTTESEIRAKAIDEFAEALYNKSTSLKYIESDDYGMLHFEEVYEIAEQLKGE